jgi:sterol desaturase/sphingolipid hydroxylase (fatty acid hydroxylase superfamily)
VSGLFYFLFYKKKWARPLKKISAPPLREGQIKQEIQWSLMTSIVFGVIGGAFFWAATHGFTAIYFNLNERGLLYYFFSLGCLLFFHDAYFYWVHRWMHQPGLYRLLHKVHHDSRTPTPFASFSFHPLESILEAVIVPLLAFIIPVHWSAFILFLMTMTISGVVNHLGYEIFPRSGATHFLTKWLVTPTHHELHHLRIRGNYGLYFTWWDRWFHTEHPEYVKDYMKVFSGEKLR